MNEHINTENVRKAADYISMGWQYGDASIGIPDVITKNVIWASHRYFNDGANFSKLVNVDAADHLDVLLSSDASDDSMFTPVENPERSVSLREYIFTQLSIGLLFRFGVINDVTDLADTKCNPCVFQITYKDKVYHGLYGDKSLKGYGFLAATLYLIADIMDAW